MTVFWIITVIAAGIDRAAKLITQSAMTLGEQVVVISGVLELRFSHNTGMALGILAGNQTANLALPILAVGAGFLLMRQYRQARFTMIAAALILGGFIGNFADRILLGYVLDMIYFPWLPFFICNPADIAITFGVAMYVYSLLFRPKDWQEKNNRHTIKEQLDDHQNSDG